MRTKLDAVSIAAVLVTVAAFSMTAPLTAYAAAPALALAFGRNALGLLTLGPVFTLIRRREAMKVIRGQRLLVRKEQRRAVFFGVLAGTALAVHFMTFMSGTQMTSVAMATALVATQPVWQALIATLFNKRLPRITWAGLTVSVVGAVVASGADLRVGDTKAVVGDVLALVGAVALAVYAALSERARPDVSTSLYSVLCFSVCTMELLAVCLVTGTPPFTFTGNTWLALLGLLICPQLLGLFSLNFALGRAPATAVSVLLLLEAPVAALIAWLWFGQLPAGVALLGLLVIMLGVTVVVAADARRADTLAGGLGEARVPVTVPAYPFPTLGAVHVGDPHAYLWSAAQEGRFEEVEATIRRLEVRAIQNHGAKSPEATHWIEVRAVVARIAGHHGLASQLWLVAARFHSSPPDRDLHAARACLDQAFHEWVNVEDDRVLATLAPALRAMYNQDPDHRPDIMDAIDRHLLHLDTHEQA
ncbi:DMT family transporter [Streptomyces sp. NRRL S-813]|uniref:DMT family transporter n=1 Tax=Streptomyces sp. NRRL S-813 TaxID=1463919 RepID=UPI0007C6E17D|nr:DMT family transporter [Streptomyces sp. NRRL S-813]